MPIQCHSSRLHCISLRDHSQRMFPRANVFGQARVWPLNGQRSLRPLERFLTTRNTKFPHKDPCALLVVECGEEIAKNSNASSIHSSRSRSDRWIAGAELFQIDQRYKVTFLPYKDQVSIVKFGINDIHCLP